MHCRDHFITLNNHVSSLAPRAFHVDHPYSYTAVVVAKDASEALWILRSSAPKKRLPCKKLGLTVKGFWPDTPDTGTQKLSIFYSRARRPPLGFWWIENRICTGCDQFLKVVDQYQREPGHT